MKQTKRTTIYDIAQALNITPATVSRALSNSKAISNATKKLVMEKAKKLNYKPNAHAFNLRMGGSRTIGVIVPQITINFFSKAIAGIEEIASLNNYTTIICQSNDDFETEKKAVETLINQNVACIMISLAAGTSNTSHLADAIKSNVKVIQFDRTDESLSTDRVINEVDETVAAMMQHLYQQGYRNIAYLAGPPNIGIFKKRREAFEKNIKKLRLPSVKKSIEQYNLDRESARAAARRLLTQKKRPDAIFASSDLGALGAWEVAKELDIKVPEELGICGFSNELYTEIISPSLTTVNQFSLKMGQVAGNIFFDSINNKITSSSKPVTVMIEPKLIIRESTVRVKS